MDRPGIVRFLRGFPSWSSRRYMHLDVGRNTHSKPVRASARTGVSGVSIAGNTIAGRAYLRPVGYSGLHPE
jgi:hypothetical protein